MAAVEILSPARKTRRRLSALQGKGEITFVDGSSRSPKEFPPFLLIGQGHEHQLVKPPLPQHLGWQLGNVIGGSDDKHRLVILPAFGW